jgi:hypothetical protein
MDNTTDALKTAGGTLPMQKSESKGEHNTRISGG